MSPYRFLILYFYGNGNGAVVVGTGTNLLEEDGVTAILDESGQPIQE